MTKTKVALVGMMASGKTSVGMALARLSGVRFVDSDHAMTARTGISVAEYFRLHGEEAFRRMERGTVRELLGEPGGMVLSLGGGAYMQRAVREGLRGRAVTVFLRVDPGEIVRRLEGTDIARRPLLAAAPDWRARVRELEAERRDVYAEADIVFEAGGVDVAQTARELAGILAATNMGSRS